MTTFNEQPYFFNKEFLVKEKKEMMKTEYRFEAFARLKGFSDDYNATNFWLYCPCVVITSPFSSNTKTLEFGIYFKSENTAFEIAKKLMEFEKEKIQKGIDNFMEQIVNSVQENLDQDIIDWFKND